MSQITPEIQKDLLVILEAMPEWDTPQRCRWLLQYLPRDLIIRTPTGTTIAEQLQNIISFCAEWGLLPDEINPLGLVIATARDMAKGPQRQQLEDLIARLPPKLVPKTARPFCPYPGMKPFGKEHAAFFCGRNDQIRDLIGLIRIHPFLAVIGPSGSGKSSLIMAELIPRLETIETAEWPAGTWRVRYFRPGDNPMRELNLALQPFTEHPADAQNSDAAITALLTVPSPATRLLLVVDQFEELITLNANNRKLQDQFIKTLQSLNKDPRCTLILTIRADFYADLMNSALWPIPLPQRFEITVLKRMDLEKAIIEPAKAMHVHLEDGLIQKLLDDAQNEPGVLPLLQETMFCLWSEMIGRVLRLEDYEKLGDHERSGLVVAFSKRADAAVGGLRQAVQQPIARRIFLRLVQFGEGRPDTRRQQLISKLRSANDPPGEFDYVLQYLTERRLLTLSAEDKTEERRVDIAHEALIAGWPIMTEWVQKRRDAEQVRRRLETKVDNWKQVTARHRSDEKEGGLLDAVALREAEDWLKSPDATELGPPDDLPALIKQSRGALMRRLRTTQGILAVLIIAVVLAAFFGYSSLTQQRETHARIAQGLAAYALGQLKTDPQLAVLLAMEAISTTRRANEPVVPAAENALHQAIAAQTLRGTLTGHYYSVKDLAFSPGGEWLATASEDHTITIWDVQTGKEIRTLTGHTGPVTSIAWSPDRQHLASGSADGVAQIWNTQTWDTPLRLEGHKGGLTHVAYRFDGQQLLTASKDGTVRVWDALQGKLLDTLGDQTGLAPDAVWSPDGKTIAIAGSSDHTAQVWYIATDRKDKCPETAGTRLLYRVPLGMPLLHEVDHVAYSPDGQFLLITSQDGQASFWQIDCRDPSPSKVEMKEGMPVNQSVLAAWRPDGRVVATMGGDGQVRLWNYELGERKRAFQAHAGAATSLSWSPDGRYLLTTGEDNSARIWDGETGQQQGILLGQGDKIVRAVYSLDGHLIATTGTDGMVQIWDAIGPELPPLFGHNQDTAVTNIIYNAAGDQILTLGDDYTARVWGAMSLPTQKEDQGVSLWASAQWQMRVVMTHTAALTSGAWQPQHTGIATADKDGQVYLWDSQTGMRLWTSGGWGVGITELAWNPDGTQLAVAGQDGLLTIWDAAQGRILRVLRGHTDRINSLAWSHDGRKILTASNDTTACIWDTATGQQLHVLTGHRAAVYTARWDAREQHIVTAGEDGLALLWNADSGEQYGILQGLPGPVFDASWSPDGRQVATANKDGTAILWNAENQHRLATLYGHQNWVIHVVWSANGKSVLTTSLDGTAGLWDTDSGQLRAFVGQSGGAWLDTAIFSPDDRRILTAGHDGVIRQFATSIADLLAIPDERGIRQLTPAERYLYLNEPLPAIPLNSTIGPFPSLSHSP